MEHILSLLRSHWLAFIIILTTAYLAHNYFNHGLHKYPGPVWARFTDWWRVIDVKKGRPDITHLSLHRKHGDVVRLGPNCLSFADPVAIKTIYGLNKGFYKSDFYAVQTAMLRGRRLWSLFASPDENFHAQFRRSVNAAFSMNSLMELEPLVSEVIELFLDRTEELFAVNKEDYTNADKKCDFARWLQYFAFDVVGQITYSRRHGFIEKNEDIDGIIAWLESMFQYAAPVGQMPVLDLFLMKSPIIRILDYFDIKVAQFALTKFARARVTERRAEIAANKRTAEETGYTDLLSKFLIAQEKRPEFMTDLRVLTMSIGISFAGSDTTAISLSAIFYHLLRNPKYMARVRQEIEDAKADGRIEYRPNGIIRWSEAQTLTFLDACIKETFRMHPAAGLMLERVVPDGGADIAGHFIPGGTIVGCSAWVIHRNEQVFGPRVDEFLPDRWLDCTKEKRKEMESCMFQFGAGSRTCIGKNISLLEIYKLVPTFLNRFEVEFADPSKDWKLLNAWFVRQDDFFVKFRSKPRQA